MSPANNKAVAMSRKMTVNFGGFRKASWAAVALGCAAVFWYSPISLAEEPMARSASAGNKSTGSSATSDGAIEAKIEKKLAKILENQETLLQAQQALNSRLDAVMEELRIIKVRSTH